jgi:hypothetical protein
VRNVNFIVPITCVIASTAGLEFTLRLQVQSNPVAPKALVLLWSVWPRSTGLLRTPHLAVIVVWLRARNDVAFMVLGLFDAPL